MTKILGIDWGEKRIGFAISDELKMLARPLKTIKTEDFKKEIEEILKEEKIKKIVVGRPRNMDGNLGSQAEKVSKFVFQFKKIMKVPVVFEDETNTSKIVEGMLIKEGFHPKKNKELIDKKAAQLILQGYLDEAAK